MNPIYANNMYNSCDKVMAPSMNLPVIDVLCGKHCDPLKWLKFTGLNSPFPINYFFKNSSFTKNGTNYTPMNYTAISCYDTYSADIPSCSCLDCPCDLPPLPIPDSPFTLMGIDGWYVIMSVIFACFFVGVTAGFIVHLYLQSRRQGEGSNIKPFNLIL